MIAPQEVETVTPLRPRDRLPEPFSDEQKQILESIEARLSAGLSLDRLSIESGIRLDYLKNIVSHRAADPLNGYHRRELTNEAFTKLATFLERSAADQSATQPNADTETARSVINVIRGAHVNNQDVAIVGAVGVGKTRAAEQYCLMHPRRFDRPGAVLVSFSTLDTKPADVYRRLIEALRPHATLGGRKDQMLRDLVGLLRPGDHIIGDECQNLGAALSAFHDIANATKVGFTMMGNFDFVANFKSPKFEALASRCSFVLTIQGNTERDLDAYLAWAGLSGADLRRQAWEIVKRPGRYGGLRGLAKVLGSINGFFPGRPLDAALLKEAAASFGGGVA